MTSNLAITGAKVSTPAPKTEQKVENNNAEKSKHQFSDTEKVIGGLSALALLGVGIYAAVRRGKINGRKFSKFDAGKAISKNGELYTGTFTHENKDGTKLVIEYKDGLLQTASKYRGEEVISTKSYKYDENNRIMSVTKNGEKIEFTRDTDGKLTGINRKIGKKSYDIKFFYDEDGKIFRTKECIGSDKIYKEFYKGTNKVKYKVKYIPCFRIYNELQIYDQEGKEVRKLGHPRFLKHEGYHSKDDKVSSFVVEDGKSHLVSSSGLFIEKNKSTDYRRSFSVDLNTGTKDQVWVETIKFVNLLPSGKRHLNPSKVFTTVEHPEYGSFNIVYDSGTKKIDFLDQKNKPDSEEVAKIIIDKAKNNYQQAYEFVRKFPKYAQEWDNDFMKWVRGKK